MTSQYEKAIELKNEFINFCLKAADVSENIKTAYDKACNDDSDIQISSAGKNIYENTVHEFVKQQSTSFASTLSDDKLKLFNTSYKNWENDVNKIVAENYDISHN